MSLTKHRFGAVAAAALGVFLLSGSIAHAWTDEEIAICAKYNKDGRVFVPGGYDSKGAFGCASHYKDPN